MQINKDYPVSIHINDILLEAELFIPEHANGLVVFAHGSGSSRHSPRNKAVAHVLNSAGIATLLVDLLTAKEDEIDQVNAAFRFDIPLLAQRLMAVTDWAKANPNLQPLKIGYFGASTGAGAALIAAAELPDTIAAVVSRGGRPDLAGDKLPLVKAPTLLIVGGRDEVVIELNQHAQQHLTVINKLEIIPNATHLFPEPGALEKVAELAKDWFLQWFKA
jgi:putative phosphoribosyl transferase